MKKAFLLLVFVFALFAFVGCRTVGSLEHSDIPEQTKGLEGFSVYEDITVYVKAANQGQGEHSVIGNLSVSISNMSTEVVTLNLDKSSMVVGVLAKRVVDGDTLRINANLSQPVLTLVPGSTVLKTLCNPESARSNSINGWPTSDSKEAKLVLCLEFSGKENFVEIPLQGEGFRSKEKIGELNVEFTSWNLLFIENAKNAAIKALTKELRSKYGEEAWLQNIEYEAEWSPLSLVLDFNMLGYVQKGTAAADVYSWK